MHERAIQFGFNVDDKVLRLGVDSDFFSNIKEIDGNFVSKRGVIPGYVQNKRLEKIKIRKQVTH